MATEAPIIVQGTADLAQMLREQERLRESTRQLADAYGVAEADVKRAQAALTRQERIVQRAAREQVKAAREVSRVAEERIRSLRQVAANSFGGIVEDIGDVVELLGAIGPASAKATAALGLIGGTALGIVAVGAAVGGAAYAVTSLAFAADDALKRLDEIPEAMRPLVSLTDEQRTAAMQLDNQWKLVGAQIDRMTAQIGGTFAPGVLLAMMTLEDLGSAANKVFSTFLEGNRQLSLAHRGLMVDIGLLSVEDVARQEHQRAIAQGRLATRLAVLGQQFGATPTNAPKGAAPGPHAAPRAAGRPLIAGLDMDSEHAEIERERQAMRAEGARREIELQQELAAEQERAHQDLLRRREEEAAAALAAKRATEDYVVAGVQGAADLAEAAGASAEIVRGAQFIATLAYQATAFARTVTDLGPIAGIPVGIGIVSSIAGFLAEARAASQSHMGSAGGRQLSSSSSAAPDEETVRVRRNQAILGPADMDRMGRQQAPVIVAIDQQMYSAAASRDTRIRSLYGRRGRS